MSEPAGGRNTGELWGDWTRTGGTIPAHDANALALAAFREFRLRYCKALLGLTAWATRRFRSRIGSGETSAVLGTTTPVAH
jgi:hypothetical protein